MGILDEIETMSDTQRRHLVHRRDAKSAKD
jgi:hypothetical protein